MNKQIFCGVAQVHLQGQSALEVSDEVIESIKEGYQMKTAVCMDYSVGTAASNMRVHDYRWDVNREAALVIKGGDASNFIEIFCQPAHVTVEETEDGIEITLKDAKTAPDPADLTLWLGSLDGDLMPVMKETRWEKITSMEGGGFAFAAVVR